MHLLYRKIGLDQKHSIISNLYNLCQTMSLHPPPCPNHLHKPSLLLCLDPNCAHPRFLCLSCTSSHSKHDLVSFAFFANELRKLQLNPNNPDRLKIIHRLNAAKSTLLEKLQVVKTKMLASLGKCEDQVDAYFARLFRSFARDSHEGILMRLQNNFTSETVQSLLEELKEAEKLEMGNIEEMSAVLQVNVEIFKQKVAEGQAAALAAIQGIANSFSQFSLAKPQSFEATFSREKKQSQLSLSDSCQTVLRSSGSGGYPLCLLSSPFSPINRSVSFLVEKVGDLTGKRSICVGACLQSVVKGLNYANCVGLGKGVYAIDQACPYSSQSTMLASWNHHDAAFNQTNVGNNNLVGWTFTEGDRIRVELDYYNSVLAFIKGDEQNWEESEDVSVYEMPIRLDQGPIYAFVSGAAKGDRVTVLP